MNSTPTKNNNNNNNIPLLEKDLTETLNVIRNDYNRTTMVKALPFIMFGTSIALMLLIFSFFNSWYRRTPYQGYNIYYYPTKASYSPLIDDNYSYNTLNYDRCGDTYHDGNNGMNYDSDCNIMKNIKTVTMITYLVSFVIFTIIIVITLLLTVMYYFLVYNNNNNHNNNNNDCFLCKTLFYNILKYKNKPISMIYIFFWLCYGIIFFLLILSYHKFVNNFPYTKFCNFYNWDFDMDSTDYCDWGNGLYYVIGCSASIATLFLYTTAIIFSSCFDCGLMRRCEREQLYAYQYKHQYLSQSSLPIIKNQQPFNNNDQNNNNFNNNNNNEPETVATGEILEGLMGNNNNNNNNNNNASKTQPLILINNDNILDESNYKILLNTITKRTLIGATNIIYGSLMAAFGFSFLYFMIFMANIEWMSSTDGAVDYVDNEWNHALCINTNNNMNNQYFYSKPQQSSLCSFSYPSPNLYVYETCCTANACQSSFNYWSLINNGYDMFNNSGNYKTPQHSPVLLSYYNLTKKQSEQQQQQQSQTDNYLNDANQCLIDLQALQKASCHPMDAYFTPLNFEINQLPTIEQKNGVFICSLFCKQTYDHCKNLIWNKNNNITIKEYFNDNAINFCENGLGAQIRTEIFTDKCFDSAVICNIYYGLIFVITLFIFGL